MRTNTFLLRHPFAATLIAAALLCGLFLIKPQPVSAAACTAPSTDYGTVSNLTVTAPAAGTYRVWTRMAAANTTDNTYKLEIDGTSCYTVGGSSVPTYASGSSTYFNNNSTNWISKTSGGAQIDVTLSAGNHSLKLIGNAPDVVVDRIVMTVDTTCVPTGTGDNCAVPPDTTSPVVAITSPANNAVVTGSQVFEADATDDVGVTKVEFRVDGILRITKTDVPYRYTMNTANFSEGAHQVTAIAFDAAGNTTTSAVVNVTIPDTTPPVISAVASSSVTQTSATITWTTDEAADSQVKYGTTTSYGSTTTLDSSKVTSHSVNITGLSAGTTYHYQVVSKDAAGNSTSSTDNTFTTAAPAADTTAPTVSVTAPTGGSTVSGTLNVTANASDNVGVVGVQFKVDGANLGTEDTTSPYSRSWNTTALSNGSHTVTAVARDAAGNTKTSATITVTVNNASFIPADINQDGSVNYLDLSLLASNYGKSGAGIGYARADINGDSIVNYLDLSVLASNYGS